MTTEKKRTFLINVAYAAVIIFLVYFFLKYAINWIMPFVIAFIVAALLHPLIKFVSRKLKLQKHQRRVAAVITALFFCTVGVLTGFIIYKIISAVSGFIVSLPEYFATTVLPNLETAYEKTRAFLAGLNIEIDTGSKTLFDSLTSWLSSLVSRIVPSLSFITSIPGMLVSFMIMIVSTFFMAMDFEKITSFCMAQLPRKTADFISELREYTVKILFKYIRSYALILGITFTELLVGFIIMHFITGLKNAFLLALLISLVDILPILGTGTIVLPWAAIAFISGDYATGICLLVIYTVISVVRQIVEPKIIGDQVGLHPIATLIAMIVGTKLFGVVGLFGLPIALAIIKDLNDKGKIHVFKPVSAYVSRKKEDGQDKDGTDPPDAEEENGTEDGQPSDKQTE